MTALSADLTTMALLQAPAGLNMNEPLDHRSNLDMTIDHVRDLRRAADEIRAEEHNGWGNICEAAADAFEANQARIAELEKALAPFAALGIHAAWMTKDDAAGAWGFDDARLTWGDFRRAAAALSIPS